jgi:halocyanin-like protein
MDRRRFVKITGVAAAAGVTGCIGGGGNGDDGEDGENGEDGGDGNGGGGGGADTTAGQDGNYSDMTGQSEVTVDVGAGSQGFKFDPADITIDAGTTVRWVWTGQGSQHNVVEADGDQPLDDPSFESELVATEGHEFTHTFEEAGTYDYVCSVHTAQNMVGSVQVEGGSGGDGGMDGGNETDGGNGGMNESDGGMDGGMDGNESMSGNESM